MADLTTNTSIEHRVKGMIARLDREHLAGQYTEEEYEDIIRSIDVWAEAQYRAADAHA